MVKPWFLQAYIISSIDKIRLIAAGSQALNVAGSWLLRRETQGNSDI